MVSHSTLGTAGGSSKTDDLGQNWAKQGKYYIWEPFIGNEKGIALIKKNRKGRKGGKKRKKNGGREETERRSRHCHQKVGACGRCPSGKACVHSSCVRDSRTPGVGAWAGCAGRGQGQGSGRDRAWWAELAEQGRKAGGSGRNEVGRDKAGRASGRNAGRQERQWLEQER